MYVVKKMLVLPGGRYVSPAEPGQPAVLVSAQDLGAFESDFLQHGGVELYVEPVAVAAPTATEPAVSDKLAFLRSARGASVTTDQEK